MTIEHIGRRVAGYRKAAGFKTAGDLADAIPNDAITKSTIQNVESGRKADLTVSQLLDISKALDIPPVALVVPINMPLAKAELPGVGQSVSEMTVWDVVEWFRVDESARTYSNLGSWIRAVMGHIEDLSVATQKFPAALAESVEEQPVFEYTAYSPEGDEYTAHHDPNEYSQMHVAAMARQAQDAYNALKRMSRTMDLTWAEGPWLAYDAADNRG
ncbi:helix-turn-helix domain-containing protein [Cryobacterium sp. 1639]|uniref:helix-turn-helix domain-containing protein n=1 Tax=Cryobacterium inferilacus TaxID=2866629 RepID=UPI001C73DF22|nr:helix-turn-helix transcriptional regulator [Cryobacterium sp. 1639]MBX0299403.1 helix-turn-helix domain-containing protein [Cryobacterium sp. 1639]